VEVPDGGSPSTVGGGGLSTPTLVAASVRWHLGTGSQRVLHGRCAGGSGQSARLGERAGAGRVAHRRRGGSLVRHGSGPPGGAQPGASLSARLGALVVSFDDTK